MTTKNNNPSGNCQQNWQNFQRDPEETREKICGKAKKILEKTKNGI